MMREGELGMAMVCQGVGKAYGSVCARDEVSFSAPNSKVSCLVGPNGAGKTAAIKALLGLIDVDAGCAAITPGDVEVGLRGVRGARGVGVLVSLAHSARAMRSTSPQLLTERQQARPVVGVGLAEACGRQLAVRVSVTGARGSGRAYELRSSV